MKSEQTTIGMEPSTPSCGIVQKIVPERKFQEWLMPITSPAEHQSEGRHQIDPGVLWARAQRPSRLPHPIRRLPRSLGEFLAPSAGSVPKYLWKHRLVAAQRVSLQGPSAPRSA